MLVKMAWRNIWRNPRRTLLTISAIAFACLLLVFMLSFQFGSYDAMINASVKIHTGHLQVQAKGYKENQQMRSVVSNPTAVEDILSKIHGVEAFTPRANAFSMVSSNERTNGVIVIGIDPEKEARVSTLKKLIRKGRYLTETDTDRILVGRLLANSLQVDLEDELTVLGQGLDGSVAAAVFRVAGIFSSGIDDLDRSTVHIPLKYFQEIYSMGRAVHEVTVVCGNLGDLPVSKQAVVSEINKLDETPSLTALDWEELMPGLSQGIFMDLVSGLITYFILIMVVAFSILNTFVMAILERTREFGMLMAIGTTPGRLTRMVLMESTLMTLIGIASGIAMGCLVTLYFQAHGINIAGASEILRQYGISGSLYPKLSLLSASIGPGMVLVITFFAALYPALRIKRLRPVEAMTHT
jgi:putative ABC transport system permease protein